MFVVHISPFSFLLSEHCLERHQSWTIIMDKDYLLLITINQYIKFVQETPMKGVQLQELKGTHVDPYTQKVPRIFTKHKRWTISKCFQKASLRPPLFREAICYRVCFTVYVVQMDHQFPTEEHPAMRDYRKHFWSQVPRRSQTCESKNGININI